MNSMYDVEKDYVSPADIFMYQFDATHEQSASQLKEIKKYQRIALLRDNPKPQEGRTEIWEDF